MNDRIILLDLFDQQVCTCVRTIGEYITSIPTNVAKTPTKKGPPLLK